METGIHIHFEKPENGDLSTLMVFKQTKNAITVLNVFSGDKACELYDILTNVYCQV